MKVGVEVLHGATIKFSVDKGVYDSVNSVYPHEWGKSTVIMLMNTLTFTPIDGKVVKGNVSGFNTGTTN
jgi:hypothetical protein